MNKLPERSVHIKLEGKVQKVGYRSFISTTAKQHGLLGWVRNQKEGWVEAVLVGTEAGIEMALQDLYNAPLAARVDSIEVSDYKGMVSGEDFYIKPSV